MQTIEEKKTLTTPRGTLLWPRITEPDYEYNAKGVFSTKIALDPSPELTEIVSYLDFLRDEFVANLKKKEPKKEFKLAEMPYKPELDENKEPTGRTILSIHSYASGVSKKTGKPWKKSGIPMYDRQGTALMIADVKPWSGTLARVNFQPFPYFINNQIGAGVTLYLQAVQIIKLVSGGARDAADYGFSDEPEPEDVGETELPF